MGRRQAHPPSPRLFALLALSHIGGSPQTSPRSPSLPPQLHQPPTCSAQHHHHDSATTTHNIAAMAPRHKKEDTGELMVSLEQYTKTRDSVCYSVICAVLLWLRRAYSSLLSRASARTAGYTQRASIFLFPLLLSPHLGDLTAIKRRALLCGREMRVHGNAPAVVSIELTS